MNRMRRDKTIFIAICIATFVSIAIVAYKFINNASNIMPDTELDVEE